MNALGLAVRTMCAELAQRALDAEFDETYDERGTFVCKRVDGPLYSYYQPARKSDVCQAADDLATCRPIAQEIEELRTEAGRGKYRRGDTWLSRFRLW